MVTVVWERDKGATQPVFFPVSLVKLTVMCVVTFGLYEFYWFYENWSLLRQRSGERMRPFWRAFFSRIWAERMFTRIARRAQDEGVPPGFSPGPMAGLLLLLTLLVRLPDPYWLVSFFTFVPLLVVQRTVSQINSKLAPDAPANARFSGLNILGVVLGGLLLFVIVVDMFVPDQPI